MHRGYVKLWRKISDNRLWTSEPFTRGQAWIDLIMLANHKDGHIRVRGIRVEVPRGTVGWSEIALSNRWKWSRGKTRRFLSELGSDFEGKIVQQKTKLTSLIKILNYDQYQGNDTTDDTTDGQQTDNRRYTNKNDKNEKNEKNITPLPPKSKNEGKTLIPSDFQITEQMVEWFNSQNFERIEIQSATDAFIDYWKSQGKMMKDWTATWRNGMRNAEKWAPLKPKSSKCGY